MPPTALKYSIEITTPLRTIENMIFAELAKQINSTFPKAVLEIKRSIVIFLLDLFEASPTYQALLKGPLDAEFGFYPGEAQGRLDAIVGKIATQTEVTFTPVRKRGLDFSGGIKISIVKRDLSEILGLPEARLSNEPNDPSQQLPWLEWLLTEGNRYIIANHAIRIGNYTSNTGFFSRSGKAIMVEKAGASWRVPAAYQGTVNDNWLTQTIASTILYIQDEFEIIVKREIQKVI